MCDGAMGEGEKCTYVGQRTNCKKEHDKKIKDSQSTRDRKISEAFLNYLINQHGQDTISPQFGFVIEALTVKAVFTGTYTVQ